jgi:hypothetical protein
MAVPREMARDAETSPAIITVRTENRGRAIPQETDMVNTTPTDNPIPLLSSPFKVEETPKIPSPSG